MNVFTLLKNAKQTRPIMIIFIQLLHFYIPNSVNLSIISDFFIMLTLFKHIHCND